MIKDIDRSEYVFTDEDFDTFSVSNATIPSYEDINIKRRREAVQQKLLEINIEINQWIVKSGYDHLYNHPKEKNITSAVYPNPHNNMKVDWMAVRYGRNPKDIEIINNKENFGMNKSFEDSDFGFLRFSCFQVGLTKDGVDIGLCHSIPNDSLDRGYTHDKIKNDPQFIDKLINVIKKLQGYGYVWTSGSEEFAFDYREAEEFPDWYSRNDSLHTYSFLTVHIPKWDKRITKENIAETSCDIIDQLYELYELTRYEMR